MYLDSKSASRPTSCHAREACRPMRRKASCRRLPERTSHSRRTTWSCTNGAFRKPFPGRDYIKNGERPENGRSRPSVSRTAVQSGHRPFNPSIALAPFGVGAFAFRATAPKADLGTRTPDQGRPYRRCHFSHRGARPRMEMTRFRTSSRAFSSSERYKLHRS